MSACNAAPECPTSAGKCNLPVFEYDCDTGLFDMAVTNCEAKTDCQIQSQLIMALFAKARDNSRTQCNRGGWWGGDIGSRLWTLDGIVIDDPDGIVNQAEQYLTEALSPLVTDGIIQDVSVNASMVDNEIVFDDIIITQPEGRTNYSYLWDRGCS